MNQYFWKSESISIHFNLFSFDGNIPHASMAATKELDDVKWSAWISFVIILLHGRYSYNICSCNLSFPNEKLYKITTKFTHFI